jgi:hypothetical protein
MSEFHVLDRKRNVIRTVDSHSKARDAFVAINAETPSRAHFIVDEKGTLFGTLKQNTEAGSSSALVHAIKLRVPVAVWATVLDASGGNLLRARDIARDAMDIDVVPESPVAIEPKTPVVVIRVSNVLRDMLERRARARGATVEEIAVSAIVGWSEGLLAKAVA